MHFQPCAFADFAHEFSKQFLFGVHLAISAPCIEFTQHLQQIQTNWSRLKLDAQHHSDLPMFLLAVTLTCNLFTLNVISSYNVRCAYEWQNFGKHRGMCASVVADACTDAAAYWKGRAKCPRLLAPPEYFLLASNFIPKIQNIRLEINTF